MSPEAAVRLGIVVIVALVGLVTIGAALSIGVARLGRIARALERLAERDEERHPPRA